jgi:hypothetical protein
VRVAASKSAQHLRYPQDSPHSNLLLTLLQRWLAATARKLSSRPPWQRQARSTNGESDGRSASKMMNLAAAF